MILTKDNLLRFVRDKKVVTHTDVAEAFETSTMIASAALSEISKDKTISITYLKGASSPYYYDSTQKDCLTEIGEKYLSKGDKDIFHKLKNSQILNNNSLSIQEKLAIERIKDFAIPLEIDFQGKEMKFWVWYLRDIKETRTQILDALKPTIQETPKKATPQPSPKATQKTLSENTIQKTIKQETNFSNSKTTPKTQPSFAPPQAEFEVENNPYEMFIENFLKQNYLKIEKKNKDHKGILYEVSLNFGKMMVEIDCYYYFKKPKEPEIIKFYTSSMKPKIVFIEKCPNKLLNLAQKVDNLTIINI